jgi:hypothetical protein
MNRQRRELVRSLLKHGSYKAVSIAGQVSIMKRLKTKEAGR